MCYVLISGLVNLFSKLAFAVKKANCQLTLRGLIKLIMENCLGHFGSFKRYILYFFASIDEKFEGAERKCTKLIIFVVVVLVQTGTNPVQTNKIWSLNVVIWLSFWPNNTP